MTPADLQIMTDPLVCISPVIAGDLQVYDIRKIMQIEPVWCLKTSDGNRLPCLCFPRNLSGLPLASLTSIPSVIAGDLQVYDIRKIMAMECELAERQRSPSQEGFPGLLNPQQTKIFSVRVACDRFLLEKGICGAILMPCLYRGLCGEAMLRWHYPREAPARPPLSVHCQHQVKGCTGSYDDCIMQDISRSLKTDLLQFDMIVPKPKAVRSSAVNNFVIKGFMVSRPNGEGGRYQLTIFISVLGRLLVTITMVGMMNDNTLLCNPDPTAMLRAL
jgi:hypothetical protein